MTFGGGSDVVRLEQQPPTGIERNNNATMPPLLFELPIQTPTNPLQNTLCDLTEYSNASRASLRLGWIGPGLRVPRV